MKKTGKVVHKVSVDVSKVTGVIKPMHGVNNGPVTGNFFHDATKWFQKAHIPYSRLHDSEYPLGDGEYVDIHCIFKDFSADADDPESYNFALTDAYLQCILDAGAQIIYRLGTSIEHQAIKRHILPPEDYEKWIDICIHIIRHYNEGWANGFHMNIEYWEIWNEPDLEHFSTPRTWAGTHEEFFRLYCMAATRLKKEFPHLKIGGPALTRPTLPYAEEFLAYLASSKERIPMDFFSWHGYVSTVEGARLRADVASELLRKYGYPEAESIYDEWNYIYDWGQMDKSRELIRNERGAAFCAGVFCTLQESELDKAMYYDAQPLDHGNFCGMFKRAKIHSHSVLRNEVELYKPYYSFEAFGQLYNLGQEVQISIDGEFLYGCAATNGKESALLLSHFCNEESPVKRVELEWNGLDAKATIYLLDETHDLEKVSVCENPPKELMMPQDTVYLIVLDNACSCAEKEEA